jgi:hypothetical protein
MDMWKWVQETQRALRADGNERLADLIYDIPQDVAGGREKLAQAALPEALAGARAIKHQWLEVFFRHWVMNGRVCRFREGEAALKEAVELFEFAHRPENIGCPQSVCTTQDISACYGNVDGPGYSVERIAVCEETLKRIDPSWGCHDCITRELIEALIDGERAPEALDLAIRHIPIARDAGNDMNSTNHWTRARAMFAAGAYEDTLTLLAFIDDSNLDDDTPADRYFRKCLRFRTLALMGRLEQAVAALPPEAEGREHDENLDLAAGFLLLCQALPEHNTYLTGRRVAAALRRYHGVGAHRLTLETLACVVPLAVARGARWAAQQALALAQPHLAKLRAPLGAPEQFAALEALVAAMPAAHALPVPAAELAEYLYNSETDPEHDLELLLVAAAELPGDAPLARCVADAMQACGAQQESIAYLWRFVRLHPEARSTGTGLLYALLEQKEHAAIAELAQLVREANPALDHWCLGRLAFDQQKWGEVGAHIARLLEVDPEAGATKALWAQAEMNHQQFERALQLRLELAALAQEPQAIHWDALVAATAAERWDAVRQLAAQLGFELDGSEGPVDERWGMLVLRFVEKGESVERYARRTGPATALVTSLSVPGEPQHVRDVVVFDPKPVHERPEDVAPEDFYYTYDVVHVLREGQYGASALVDGAHPGDEQFAQLCAALDALDWEWSVRSGEDYEVYLEEAGETLRGLYFAVAAPAAVSPALIDAKLKELTAGFTHPMCWPTLAAQAGADEAWHWDVVERYQL